MHTNDSSNFFLSAFQINCDEDPNKIAESFRALAWSVKDDTEMFGDLPRRRLNTGDLVRSRPI